MRNNENVLAAGVAAQREKLDENAHKKGLEGYPVDRAFHRAIMEMGELSEALMNEDTREVRREAADICNFLHAIIYAMDQKMDQEIPCVYTQHPTHKTEYLSSCGVAVGKRYYNINRERLCHCGRIKKLEVAHPATPCPECGSTNVDWFREKNCWHCLKCHREW